MKKLNSEWIHAQQTGENRTSKQTAGWKTKNKTKRSHTEERKEPYDALERTTTKQKKQQPGEKDATRKVKKGRKTLKRSGERPKNKPP